jgi:hypothetical protein
LRNLNCISAVCAIALSSAVGYIVPSAATPITFNGSGTVAGNSVSATATFSIVGDTLTITLQNTSVANSLESPGSTLSGLFFDIGSLSLALTPTSATASAIFHPAACNPGPCTAVHDVAGEWGYAGPGAAGSSFAGGPSVTYGIGSSGYLTTGLAGDIGNFNGGAAGTNLDDPASLDGINFGIISATVGPLNGGLSSTPLVQDLMTLTLTGNGNDLVGLDPSALINTVSFQYGTSFDETGSNIPGIPLRSSAPEPQSFLLLALGLVMLAGQRMMRKA